MGVHGSYPRVGGGTVALAMILIGVVGLSPRGRGNHGFAGFAVKGVENGLSPRGRGNRLMSDRGR